MPKTVIFTLIATFFSFLIIFGLSRQIFDALNAGGRLEKSVDEVNTLQEENRRLKNQLSTVSEQDYMEQIARDKLNLALPNETIVFIPQEEINRVIEQSKPVIEVKVPFWQGWLKLFFD